MENKHLITVTEEYNKIKLDKFLLDKFGVSFSLVRKMCRKGQVRVNSSRAKGNEMLKVGDIVKVPNLFLNNEEQMTEQKLQHKPLFSEKQIKDAKKMIIFEDDDILVINKPAGIPVQAGSKQDKSIDRLFEAVYPESPPKLVHRLDKDTSGCLIMAKNKSVAKTLATQFAERTTDKTYLAVVRGNLADPAGEINFSVEKIYTAHNAERVKVVEKFGREAFTSYKRIARNKDFHYLEVKIHTGRTHQIRVHMQSIGTPILGDLKYADKAANVLPNGKRAKMCLHSYTLKLKHPTSGKIIELKAPIASHIQDILDLLSLSK